MTAVEENVLHSAPLIDDSAAGMKTVGRTVKAARTFEELSFETPLCRSSVFRCDAVEVDAHVFAFRLNDLIAAGDRIETDGRRIDRASRSHVGVGDILNLCVTKLKLHLREDVGGCLIADNGHKPVVMKNDIRLRRLVPVG